MTTPLTCVAYNTAAGCPLGGRCEFLHIISEPASSPRSLRHPANAQRSTPSIPTSWTNDGPGHLSMAGPRHDNDFVEIKDITVLPTLLEIKAPRPQYLPAKHFAQWHRQGFQGVLDRNFRLLREDTIGQIRDAVAKDLEACKNTPARSATRATDRLPTHVYPGVTITRIYCDPFRGFSFEIAFPQPPQASNGVPGRPCYDRAQARKEWWDMTNRLEFDAIVALLYKEDLVLFCAIAQEDWQRNPKSKPNEDGKGFRQSRTLHSHQDMAYTRLRLLSNDSEAILSFLQNVRELRPLRLIEFPGTLFPSFGPTLEALKKMSVQHNTPFIEYLSPAKNAPAAVKIPPPAYALRPGFTYDLSCILTHKSSLQLQPVHDFDATELQKKSTLDKTQARSVVAALTQRLALIQGPPGTGKSFTGVSLIKVLLHNKQKADIGPIICVCYTNHALDQLLENLIKGGVDKVVRMGSGSKSDIVMNFNLKDLVKGINATKNEKAKKKECQQKLDLMAKAIEAKVQNLRNPVDWRSIKDFLCEKYPTHHDDLFGEGKLQEPNKVTNRHPDRVLADWLRQGSSCQPRPPQLLLQVLPSKMSSEERSIAFQGWTKAVQHQTCGGLRDLLDTFESIRTLRDLQSEEKKRQLLEAADIIGVTTSGLAKENHLLGQISAKVMLCEEAGEILEAHTLVALLPTIEHAIFIGDHQQLRPRVSRHEFSRESFANNEYAFDTSLFERLVDPGDTDSVQLPYSTLETQRRMHPDISRLVRQTLYPELRDAQTVSSYPAVPGLRRRVYWLDHRCPETGEDTTGEGLSTSRSNNFEVDYCEALVLHLLKQGVYQAGEIAVLTPYLGQLEKLRRRLEMRFELSLDDRDLHPLKYADTTLGPSSDGSADSQRVSALSVLRLATVDNFQGEEAKVVIVSLVRSNRQNSCGFLRTPNRVNVLLSRAQHGMYLIGNAQTYGKSGVSIWQDVIQMLTDKNQIGKSLPLQCPRHPETPLLASRPEDFLRSAPQGGCGESCCRQLQCGHICKEKCHGDLLHNQVSCSEPCTKICTDCGSSCSKRCGDECALCTNIVRGRSRILNCGHVQNEWPCWQTREVVASQCEELIELTMKGCGHKLKVHCYESEKRLVCTSRCSQDLECGHKCARLCGDCPRNEGTEVHLGRCGQACGKQRSSCSHKCTQQCHHGRPCMSCEAPCESRCQHFCCNKSCDEVCVPCLEEACDTGCAHRGCSLPCAAPCNGLPCSSRCDKLLICGHRCPSVCGEVCPAKEYCQICGDSTFRRRIVDDDSRTTYSQLDLYSDPVIIPQCGHITSMSCMDRKMSMSEHYILSKTGKPLEVKPVKYFGNASKLPGCPQCDSTIWNIARYSRSYRTVMLGNSIKKLVTRSRRQYLKGLEKLQSVQSILQGDVLEITSLNKSNSKIILDLTGSLAEQIMALIHVLPQINLARRYTQILALLRNLATYWDETRRDEQPLRQLSDACLGLKRSTNSTNAVPQIPRTGETANALQLLLRCHRAILTDILVLLRSNSDLSGEVDLRLDLETCRALTVDLANEARKDKRWAQLVEAHCAFAHYVGIEVAASDAVEKRSSLQKLGAEHVADAQALCLSYPGLTLSMGTEVETIGKMCERRSVEYVECCGSRLAIINGQDADERKEWHVCLNDHVFVTEEGKIAHECSECGVMLDETFPLIKDLESLQL